MTNATTQTEWSRHHHVRAGTDFYDAIWRGRECHGCKRRDVCEAPREPDGRAG